MMAAHLKNKGQKNKGQLTGIGVGPGDPELVTRKGWQLITQAKIIAYLAPDTGPSFARQIVAGAIAPDAQEIAIIVPMQIKREPAQSAYDKGAAEISAYLDQGRDVVILCEGDPLFFGSFMYLLARLKGDYDVQIIPGITSHSAASASAKWPLAARNDVLTILSGAMDDAALSGQIKTADSVVIMKVGRHLARLKALIDRLGFASRAWYVSHASLPHQISCALAEAPLEAPYFSIILITKDSDPWLN